MSVNRPRAELDCCYEVTKQTGETEQMVKSVVVKNAKKNPNFDDSVDIFDVVSTHLLFYHIYLLVLFTQDSIFSTYCTVINEGPEIEALIVFKLPFELRNSVHSIRQPRRNCHS